MTKFASHVGGGVLSARRTLAATLFAAFALVATAPAADGADDNDVIGNAFLIAEGVELRFDARNGGVLEPGEAPCFSPPTLWWSFTAPAADSYVAYATGSNFDTSIGWFADLATQTGACPDAADGSDDAVEDPVFLGAGEQEYVAVGGGFDTQGGGVGGVGVARLGPISDSFASVQTLHFEPGAPSAVAGVRFLGTETVELGEPVACGTETGFSETGWATFTPPSTGSWMFEAKFPDATAVALYTGTSVAGLTQVACSADEGHRALLTYLTAGTTYRVQLANIDGGATAGVLRAERAVIRQTPELVDADGGGSSTSVGDESSVALLPDGRPAVAYFDQSENALRYAERAADGTWTDVLADVDGAGVGHAPSLAVVGGNPAISYYDLIAGGVRYAERSAAGVWSDVLVDAGLGFVPSLSSLVTLPGGAPAISYCDVVGDQLRFAERDAAGQWSDRLVHEGGCDRAPNAALLLSDGRVAIAHGDTSTADARFAVRALDGTWSDELVDAGGLVGSADIDLAQMPGGGELVVAYTDDGSEGLRLGRRAVSGGGWTVESVTIDTDLAELGNAVQVGVDVDGRVVVAWGAAGTGIGYAVRAGAGMWVAQDAVSHLSDPRTTGAFDSSTVSFGLVTHSDGRLAATLHDSRTGELWYLEDALDADAGGPYTGLAGQPIQLSAAGSVDRAGLIVDAAWTVPGGCTVTETGVLTAALTCPSSFDGFTGAVSVQVTDDDGLTHRDDAPLAIGGALACPNVPTPFVDIAGNFAEVQVRCIYGLGITAGVDATHYGPSGTVTREQMAVFLARLYEAATGAAPPVVVTPFTDIAGSFADEAIGQIYGLGITAGVDATHYGPAIPVAREQMAVFLDRLYAAVHGVEAPVVATPFVDTAGGFAEESIGRIYGLGVTAGVDATHYGPAAPVARDQMAVFLARLYEAA